VFAAGKMLRGKLGVIGGIPLAPSANSGAGMVCVAIAGQNCASQAVIRLSTLPNGQAVSAAFLRLISF
jgi:hypothetical protein